MINILKNIIIYWKNWIADQITFNKILVVCLVYKGIGWVDQSYALAWAGKEDIAETLSHYVVTEILGVTMLYTIKAIVENAHKYPNVTENENLNQNQNEDEKYGL